MCQSVDVGQCDVGAYGFCAVARPAMTETARMENRILTSCSDSGRLDVKVEVQ